MPPHPLCYDTNMRNPPWFDSALTGELLSLLLAAPLLYFPDRFPAWAPWLGFALLIAGWVWRRRMLGIWLVRTPADWPILFLFFVMLPVAVWAAPDPLRIKYSIPRAYILVWNFCLFWTMVTYTSRVRISLQWFTVGFIALGTAIALVAPLGMLWLDKLPGLGSIVRRIPSPLVGIFRGAESGFSANQVAGALLYVLPLAATLVIAGFARNRRRVWYWLLCLSTGWMILVVLLTQSRSGLIGLATGFLAIAILRYRWGRWLMLFGGIAVSLVLILGFDPLLQALNGLLPIDVNAQTVTLVGRVEVWNRAFYGIQDFPFTGMGLGTFREIVWLLYPPFLLEAGFDLAHAHNFFIQQALDFGIPGLIALLAMYASAAIQIAVLWRRRTVTTDAGLGDLLAGRPFALGLAASLIAQTVYSQTDVVAMGSKPNLLFWYFLALILGGANLALTTPKQPQP